MSSQRLALRGVEIRKEWLDPEAQRRLVAAIRDVASVAPFVDPVTPGGRKMSVRMTAAGRLGWITDRRGYRYSTQHPSGVPWPPIPGQVLSLWADVTGLARPPDCCLVNYYGEGARMGMHQDRDEGDFTWPVVSVSLGDAALFRIGGTERGGRTESIWLESGDVAIMAGPSRLAWHGIDRLRFGCSGLLAQGGRLNLTLRVVEQAGGAGPGTGS